MSPLIVLFKLGIDGNKEDIDTQEDIQHSPDDLSDEKHASLTENTDGDHQGSSEDLLNDDEDISPLEIGEMGTNMFFDTVVIIIILIIIIIIIIIVIKVVYQRASQPRVLLLSLLGPAHSSTFKWGR